MSTLDPHLVGVIVGRSDVLGSVESRVVTPGGAFPLLASSGVAQELLQTALLRPYTDVIMDDAADTFATWSARSFTVLPVVCSVEHDGGFTETV